MFFRNILGLELPTIHNFMDSSLKLKTFFPVYIKKKKCIKNVCIYDIFGGVYVQVIVIVIISILQFTVNANNVFILIF